MTIGVYFLTGLVIGLIWFVCSAFFIRKHTDKIKADERQGVFWMACVTPTVSLFLMWSVIIPLAVFGGFCALIYKWIFKLTWKQLIGDEP